MSDNDNPFDPNDYTPERTLARITELQTYLRDELLPEAEARTDSIFVADFIRYLDVWSVHFANQLHAPLEFLAFVTRNLLEFSLLLPIVFENAESRALFLNEALRLDVEDLKNRLSKAFAAIDATLPETSIEDLDWLPPARVRLSGKRDVFDDWFHKFCSKLMHPTAIMIVAPQALTDSDKRLTFRFAGLQYLGRSYNVLAKVVFDR
jgi:hypothetical protein